MHNVRLHTTRLVNVKQFRFKQWELLIKQHQCHRTTQIYDKPKLQSQSFLTIPARNKSLFLINTLCELTLTLKSWMNTRIVHCSISLGQRLNMQYLISNSSAVSIDTTTENAMSSWSINDKAVIYQASEESSFNQFAHCWQNVVSS